MKSILVGLILILWTHSFQAYTQTDSAYCLPISKARLLVADAMKLKMSDSIHSVLVERMELLESENLSLYSSFTNLLKIEADKLQIQKEITLYTESISATYKDQNDTLKKQVRKLKWQRAGLAAVTVLMVAVSL